MAAYVETAGTVGAGGANGYAIYDDSGNLVDSTPSDDNLWVTVGWAAKSFTTPIAAQSSGRFVYAAIISAGYASVPNIVYNTSFINQVYGGIGLSSTKRHNMYNGVSSLPASFDPNSYASGNTYVPIIGLA
jgi:hypothetical protein